MYTLGLVLQTICMTKVVVHITQRATVWEVVHTLYTNTHWGVVHTVYQ